MGRMTGIRRYDKLVRDKIPEIIQTNGQRPVIRQLSPAEFRIALKVKVIEELGEFMRSPSVDEAADLLEALHALVKAHGLNWDAVETERAAKAVAKGTFENRLFLKAVWDRLDVDAGGT